MAGVDSKNTPLWSVLFGNMFMISCGVSDRSSGSAPDCFYISIQSLKMQ